jgi:hypothetical protein
LETLRLAYAAHIYRQQGATVKRSIVLTGGWQTSRESSYVNASRARDGTDWYLAREELGHDGTDIDRIDRLAEKMRSSRAQIPSVAYEEMTGWNADPPHERLAVYREDPEGRTARPEGELEQWASSGDRVQAGDGRRSDGRG